MQLLEIYIDGFGVFCDKHVKGLSSGINVLYGPNEFGKSTLLAFVRRILFGFRASASENPYPAISGGAYGGRIVCRLASGKIVTISRKAGTFGGPVQILTDSTELSGQEELNTIIDRISERFYENVYAISLDELQTTKTLEEEEIKNQIYGAGLELGKVSLTDIQNTFQKQAEEIFKPAAPTKRIPALYKEILAAEKGIVEGGRLLSKYDELVNERDGLQAQIESFDSEIIKADQDQERLKTQKTLFSTYINLRAAEADLTNLGETPQFSEDALSKLEKLETAVSILEKQTKADDNILDELKLTRDSLLFDERIIEVEQNIISLQKQSERFKSASQDIGHVIAEGITLSNNIKTKIEKLGSGWTEERVRDFKISHLQEDQNRESKNQIDEAKRRIENIKSKLEAHLDSKALEESSGVPIVPFLRNTGYVSLAVGTTGFILGFVFTQPAMSVFSACLLIVGLIITVSGRKPNPSPVFTPLERKYKDDLSTAESEYRRVSDEWKGQLRKMGTEENLSPDGSIEIVKTIKEIQANQNMLAELNSRIQAMQDAINTVNNLLNQIYTSIGKARDSDDVVASIELLIQQLSNAKTANSKHEMYEKDIKKQQAKIRDNQEDLERAKGDLQGYVASFSASNLTDFRLKYQVFREREELKKVIEECRRLIQLAIGIGEHYDKFLDSMSVTDPATVSTKLEIEDKRLEDIKKQRDGKKERIGELRNRIEDLSAKDLAEDQTRLEEKKQQLKDHSINWVRDQIALFVLAKAISKYENTRQPEVVKAATNIFDIITNHKYPLIIKPTGANELVIQDNSALRKTIKEMSRGTKEQLYFAMRLGLICVYETKSEPMPIVMDDILVNFDDARGLATIEGLIEFAKKRQVIVLTCHKNNLDIYKRLNIRELEFQA